MNMKKYILILFLLISLVCLSQKQTLFHYHDSLIIDLIKLYQLNNSSSQIHVYSIQLESSEMPEKIKKIKNQYELLFPNELIDEIFEPPYFKAITGSYLDRKKAQKKLKLIQKKFKSAFVLKREISIEKL